MNTHLATFAVIAMLLTACASNSSTSAPPDQRFARVMNAVGAMILGRQVQKSNSFMAKPVEPARKQTFCQPIQGGYLHCW